MRVDIWSDIVCPWCYVGKRRFETALARFEDRGGCARISGAQAPEVFLDVMEKAYQSVGA
jgi:predicted DsbA family dithiol-disulfide isomerase